MTDTVSDLINRINNAKRVGKDQVIIPYSRFKFEIVKALETLGYLSGAALKKDLSYINIAIKGKRDFSEIRRTSKPGRRVYSKANVVPRPKSGYGEVVISTPRGVLSGKDARRQHLGGEIICEVY